MVFPATPLDLRTELWLGTWVDVTGYHYSRDDVTISRGRPDESSQVVASTASATLDNRTGRFSPRLPTGPYYGKLGRNTPIRMSIPEPAGMYLRCPGAVGDKASCPDTAGISIVGDIDVRIDLAMVSWQQEAELVSKWAETGNQRSWQLYLQTDGILFLRWSTDGVSSSVALSSVPVPSPASGRQALRATLAVATGTVTFYTAPTMTGAYTQLGATTVVGATSIFDSTARLEVADAADGFHPDWEGPAGKIYSVRVLSGIGGTAKANPDFFTQASGTTSFADAAANTWTVAGGCEITDRQYRFYGEVSSWPPKRDVSGKDIHTSVEAAGILRRLGQGATPLRSAMYRATIANLSSTAAYWPLEDGTASTVLASGIPGGLPMTLGAVPPNLAASSVFACSEPIITLPNVALLNAAASITGVVPAYTPTTTTQIRWLMAAPLPTAGNGNVISFFTTGTAAQWVIAHGFSAGDNLYVIGTDSTGAIAAVDGTLTPLAGVDGKLLMCSLSLTQVGANFNWSLSSTAVGSSIVNSVGGTATGYTIGKINQVILGANGALNGMALGHVTVTTTITPLDALSTPLAAAAGELAGRRFQRLCAEEGVSFQSIGDLTTTAAMGPQSAGKFVDLLQECADADAGILYEPREVLGLGYRTRTSLYGQAPAATIDYSAGLLSGGFEPVDDDQTVRNSIVVTRTNASSVSAALKTGALSTQAPPLGVGKYDTSVTVNVALDSDLPDQAGWRLLLGTVDETRYPSLTIDRAGPGVVANPALDTALQVLDVGDRVVMTNVPSDLPPDAVSQIVQGISEVLGQVEHSITINGSPESPYRVATLDDTVLGHLDTDGSVLNTGVNTVATSWSVATTSGPLWTTSAGDFPFDVKIAGEVVTVTNITGAASPQTFTVTRSTNGVVKSHLSGEDIRLAQPMILAL